VVYGRNDRQVENLVTVDLGVHEEKMVRLSFMKCLGLRMGFGLF
jgi:hypothetical protein